MSQPAPTEPQPQSPLGTAAGISASQRTAYGRLPVPEESLSIRYDVAHKPPVGSPLKTTLVLVFGAVVFAALIIAGVVPRLQRESRLDDRESQLKLGARRVQVGRPVVDAGAAKLKLPATLQAYQASGLFARVDGYVAKWNADRGDPVKAGQVLAELSAPELDQQVLSSEAAVEQASAQIVSAEADVQLAEAEVSEAKPKVDLAQANLDFQAKEISRLHKLAESNNAAERELNQVTRDFDAAKADLASAQAGVVTQQNLLRTRQSQVAVSKANLKSLTANLQRLKELQSFKRIIAPFDGIVTRRNAEVGQLVTAAASAGTPLFNVAQTNVLRVVVDVPQTYAEIARPGVKATVVVPERPGETYDATITRNSGALDVASRTLRIELDLPNAAQKLLPGTFVDVELSIPRDHPVVVVPANTLMFSSAGSQAAVVQPDGKLHLQTVRVGRDFGSTIEVIEGLAGDELLVLNPTVDLLEGEPVQVVPVASAPASQP